MASATTNANLIPFQSETFSKTIARVAREWLDGSAGEAADRQGVQSVSGSVTCRMVYDEEEGTNEGYGVGLLLALASQCGLGSSTYAATGYNRYTPANDLSRFITLAMNKDVSDWSLVGVKCSRFRIYGNMADGKVMADFDLQAWDLQAYPKWGSTNATEGPDQDITGLRADFTTEPTPVNMSDLTLRLGDRVNVLASGDNTEIASFDFTCAMGLSEDEYTTPSSSAENSRRAIEAEGAAKLVSTLALNFPRYSSDTHAGWYEDDTALQAEFEFAYSTTRNLWLRFPLLKATDWKAPVTGPGLVKPDLMLRAYRPNASDTVYATTGYFENGSTQLLDENDMTVEWGIETWDDRRDDPFAIA